MSNNPTTMVLYHGGGCPDGFASAWIAHQVLGETAVYVPVQYGQPYPPEIDSGAIKDLYILDFSYPLETMNRLALQVLNLVVIDHHKTAQGPLKQFLRGFGGVTPDGAKVIFDANHSGAWLTWMHFFSLGRRESVEYRSVPPLVLYVEDRDLWAWKLQCSREINAAIRSYPFEFAAWNDLAEDCQDLHRRHGLQVQGEAILRAQAQQVESHVRQALPLVVGGHLVLSVNATVLMSEIGEALCEKRPELPFAATYYVDGNSGQYVWSLRSRNGFDVSEVAKKFGGGGHPAAAGFRSNRIAGL